MFAFLSAFTYEEFMGVLAEMERGGIPVPTGMDMTAWRKLLFGAAVSAGFAFVLTIMFYVLAALLLICASKSLSHPGRNFGRGFVVAAAIWTFLHILNITLQFQSYAPMLGIWHDKYQANFNPMLLRTTVVFGYVSSVFYAALAVLVMFWHDHPDPMYEGMEALEGLDRMM
eukprot:jgi/Chrzof1/544/Cz01g19200.t1